MQPRGLSAMKSEAEILEDAADIESLRAAYLAVAGQSGRVVSGKKMKETLNTIINTVPVQAEPVQIPVQIPAQNSNQNTQLSIQISIQSPNQTSVPVSSSIPVQSSRITPPARQMPPIDAALLAIAEAESESECYTADTSYGTNKTSIEQALLREQEFAFSHTEYQAPVEVPRTMARPTIQPQATRIETIARSAEIQPTAPVAQAVQAESLQPAQHVQHVPAATAQQTSDAYATTYETTSEPAAVNSQAGSTRPVKLPKFLVSPEGETLNGKTMTSTGNGSFNPLSSQLPPVPQNLFSDLKPSSIGDANMVNSLAQAESPVAPSMTNKSTTTTSRPVKQYFDTTSGTSGKGGNQASFIDFLSTTPNTAQKSVADVPVENGEEWVDRYQRYESTWVKLFERPRLLLGVLGLGIVTCSVYIALGYWWFGGSPTSQAAETVNMLNIDDSVKSDSDPTTTFNNIHSIQNGSSWTKSKDKDSSKSENVMLAQAAPAGLAGEPASSGSSDTEPVKFEPVGRPDPFAPLVSAGGDAPSKEEEAKKKDVLLDLQYTGFIGDISSRDKVAIIRVNDSLSGTSKTQIKKVGESFVVDGELVVLRGISKKALLLTAQGETRQLPIQQYQAVKAQPQDPNAAGPGGVPGGSGPAGSGAAAGPAGPAGPGGPVGAAGYGASTGASSMRGYGGSPANVSLSEPKS